MTAATILLAAATLFCAAIGAALSAPPTRALARQTDRCPALLGPHKPDGDARADDPRIVGGAPGNADLARYLVALTGPSKCTGTLVAANIVVTAAHCGVTTLWTATVGRTGPGGTEAEVGIDTVVNHASYAETPTGMHFDIALVQLSQSVAQFGKIMKVNVNPALPMPGAALRVAGYGVFRHDQDPVPGDPQTNPNDLLHQVDFPAVEFDRCNRVYDEILSDKYQFCTGYAGRGGCDSCQGDSGGPVFQYDKADNPVLVGVVSTGRGCAGKEPGVNVRVSMFDEWFKTFDLVLDRSEDAVQVDSGFTPSDGSSTGTIVGAVVAVVVVVAVAVVAVLYIRRKRGDADTTATAPAPTAPVAPPPAQAVATAQPAAPAAPSVTSPPPPPAPGPDPSLQGVAPPPPPGWGQPVPPAEQAGAYAAAAPAQQSHAQPHPHAVWSVGEPAGPTQAPAAAAPGAVPRGAVHGPESAGAPAQAAALAPPAAADAHAPPPPTPDGASVAAADVGAHAGAGTGAAGNAPASPQYPSGWGAPAPGDAQSG